MTCDDHGRKRPLPHPWVRKVNAVVSDNWRLALFVILMICFLAAPFFSPFDMPLWMIRD